MKLKKDDLVKVIAGAHKGKTGKIVSAHPRKNTVAVEGIGIVKRHVKPTQINPRGGTKEVHIPLDVSKVSLVKDKKKGKK